MIRMVHFRLVTIVPYADIVSLRLGVSTFSYDAFETQ